MKILIVEDEQELSKSIATYMAQENYLCEVCYNMATAMEKIQLYDYDCVLLDLGLPEGNGLKILKELKTLNKADGVLIISAKNSLEDKVSGLNLGADDFLAKPFHLPELSARVAAIIRRKQFLGSNEVKYYELTIDTLAKSVRVSGQPMDLTAKEYQLLLYMVVNKGRVISKNAIAEHLWGDNMDMADNYDFIYTHVKNLRKKLAENGIGDYINSIYGMGYKFGAK